MIHHRNNNISINNSNTAHSTVANTIALDNSIPLPVGNTVSSKTLQPRMGNGLITCLTEQLKKKIIGFFSLYLIKIQNPN